MNKTTERVGDWIQTYSGLKAYPLDLRPDEVCIDDIAHSLAHLNRFTGHTKVGTYSVAQHCVLASAVVSPRAQMAALLHDAAEAYTNDVSRPVKKSLYVKMGDNFVQLKMVEVCITARIFDALNVPVVDDDAWAEVERADMILLATEKRDLLGARPKWSHEYDGHEPLPYRIEPWTPGRASWEFRQRFVELGGKR